MARSRKKLCLHAHAQPENNSLRATCMGNWIELPAEVGISYQKRLINSLVVFIKLPTLRLSFHQHTVKDIKHKHKT